MMVKAKKNKGIISFKEIKPLQMIRGQLSQLKLMLQSNAPIWFILTHFRLHYLHRISVKRKKMKILELSFREFAQELKFDNDWFTPNIPTWLTAFQKNNFDEKTELNCLEIGSWQGMSAVFILKYFERAQLTCVDTWEGADEHQSEHSTTSETLMKVEEVFDFNLSPYKQRLTKFKGTSYQYFNNHFDSEKFDLIYIDGSHHSDDVILDAIKAFQMLKVNGLIIFDDYFWNYYIFVRTLL